MICQLSATYWLLTWRPTQEKSSWSEHLGLGSTIMILGLAQQTSPMPGHSPLLPISQILSSLLLRSKRVRTCSVGGSLGKMKKKII